MKRIKISKNLTGILTDKILILSSYLIPTLPILRARLINLVSNPSTYRELL